MRLILARHCRTDWNARSIMQGRTDIPLDEVGRAQARGLAEKLRGMEIALIVASSLSRARQTGRIVSTALKTPFKTDKRLRECDFGSLEGLTFEEFDAKAGAHNLKTCPQTMAYDFSPFGGDKAVDVLARQLECLDALAKIYTRGDQVMLVGHGRSLRTLYYGLCGARHEFEHAEYLLADY